MPYTYDYPRPMVTVDIVLLTAARKVLLIQRKNEPFKDQWALPGGFVDMQETVEEAAHRELEEETGLKNIHMEQMQVFSSPGRDPRGRTISVVFTGFLKGAEIPPRAGDDARNAAWVAMDELPGLAFDHTEIINFAKQKYIKNIE